MTNESEFLTALEVPGFKGVFHIACTAKRATLHSQQKRAFNLAYALQKEHADLVEKGTKVAIVGAGGAGLTAATAFVKLGCEVHIFERSDVVLPLQRGCLTRHLHPNIYDWPNPASKYPVTHLPYMNWSAANSDMVAKRLLEQWQLFADENKELLREHLLEKVEELSFDESTEVWKVKTSTNSAENIGFRLVIIAAGFGIENLKDDPTCTPSYWRNDDLAQHPFDFVEKSRTLIVGSGDGALIDAMRMTMQDFNHKSFSDWLVSGPAEPFWKQAKDLDGGDEINWKDWYEKFTPAGAITEHIDSIVRHDTEVYLSVRSGFPSNKACKLNNFVAASLSKHGALKILRREFKRATPEKNGGFWVEFADEEKGEHFDRVIVRKGPDSAIGELKPEQIASGISKRWTDERKRDDTTGNTIDKFWQFDEFMNLNNEKEFRVVFALVDSLESKLQKHAQERFSLNLKLGGGKVPLSKEKYVELVLETVRYDSKEYLVLISNSKKFIYQFLESDEHPYFEFRFYWLRKPAPDFRPELDDGANVVFITDTKTEYYSVYQKQCKNELRSVHRILDISMLTQILTNQLPLTRIHFLSWFLCQSDEHIKDHFR